MPSIEKQQELYKIHVENGGKKGLEVCATCQQVVLTSELKYHLSKHTLDNHFPSLGNQIATNNVWKK